MLSPGWKVPATAASIVVMLALVGGGVAYAATSTSSVKVCVTSKNVVRSADAKSKCPKKTRSTSVNVRGPQGPAGATGSTGAQGPAGLPGAGAPALDSTTPQKLTFTIGSTDNVIFDDGRLRWVTTCDYTAETDTAAPAQPAMSSTFTALDESTLNVGVLAQAGRQFTGGQSIALAHFAKTTWNASGVVLAYAGSQTDLSTGTVKKHIDIRGWSTETGCTFYVRQD